MDVSTEGAGCALTHLSALMEVWLALGERGLVSVMLAVVMRRQARQVQVKVQVQVSCFSVSACALVVGLPSGGGSEQELL